MAVRRAGLIALASILGPAALGCSGSDGCLGPSGPAYYTLLQDARCGTAGVADTVMQPGRPPGGPNAGSGFIDSVVPADRPPRTVLWVLGTSRATGGFAQLTFMLKPIDSDRVNEQRRYLYRLWTKGLAKEIRLP